MARPALASAEPAGAVEALALPERDARTNHGTLRAAGVTNEHPLVPGRGVSLPERVRAPIEAFTGARLADVRMHTGPGARHAAASLGAAAFATENHVVWGAVADPGSARGHGLLSHEIGHVLEQRALPRERHGSLQRYETHEHIELGATESLIGSGEQSYVVQRGDYLIRLAQRFGVTEEALKARNADRLHVWVIRGNRIEGFRAGDQIVIPSTQSTVLATPRTLAAGEEPQRTLNINGVSVTYGEVIALGDFVASPDDLYAMAAVDLTRLVALLRTEMASPGTVTTEQWNAATNDAYLTLAQANVSHFAPPDPTLVATGAASGVDHKSQWEQFHAQALALAQAGDRDRALVVNAFGDHFLTDAFSAGHLFNKQDLMRRFATALAGNEAAFIDAVAAEVFGDATTAALVSQFESGEPYALGWHPNIDSASRFSTLLQRVHAQEPSLVENAVAKAVHDHLNTTMVDVENARGDHWTLSGDGTLNDATRAVAVRAVAQSQVNVINITAGMVGPLDLNGLFQQVWDYVPHPTAGGVTTVTQAVTQLADPAQVATRHAVALIVNANIQTIIDELVRRGALRRA